MSENTSEQPPVLEFLGLDAEKSRKYAGWLTFEAILLIILGILAIILPAIFSVGLSLFLGWLFLFGGIFAIVSSFQGIKSGAFFWHFITGVLTTIAGILILIRPLEGVLVLTMVVAVYYAVDGIFRIVYGLQASGTPGSGIMIINGIFGLLIAAIVYSEWPYSAEWFLGLLVGINLLIGGIFMLRFSTAIKSSAAR